MHRDPTPHTRMHRNRHPSSKCTRILPLTHEWIEIITPQENAVEFYPSHKNAPKSSSLGWMHRNLTPLTWMYRYHHPSSKCTEIVPLTHKCSEILPLTHECTEIVIPQVNAEESYPSHMIAPKSSLLNNAPRFYPSHMEWNPMQWNPTLHTWMHRNHHSSSKWTGILPLTHECTNPLLKWMHRKPIPHTWMHRNHHPSGKCTGIIPLTHECTEIVIPQEYALKSYPSRMNALRSYPSHINAPKSSSLK